MTGYVNIASLWTSGTRQVTIDRALHHFGQRSVPGVIDEVTRSAGETVDGGVIDVETEVVVQRGEDFLKLDGT